MKQFMIRRVLPVVLCFALTVPLFVVPVGAVDFPSGYRDTDSVDYWAAEIKSPPAEELALFCALANVPVDAYTLFWKLIDRTVNQYGPVSYTELGFLCSSFNSAFKNEMQYNAFQQLIDGNTALYGWTLCAFFGLDVPNFVVAVDPETNLHRIKDKNSGLWVVDSQGRYPYFEADEDTIVQETGDHWVSANEVYNHIIKEGKPGVPMSKSQIEAVIDRLRDAGEACGEYEIGASGKIGINKPGYFWCDSEGRPYFYWENEQAAIEQPRPSTDVEPEDDEEEPDTPEGTPVGIDLENMIVVLPDGTIVPLIDIIYNPTTNNYEITTYDIENNEYNYYTYEYYINYTYVTYIGETSDFEAYKCYYELPDGRNSADLTREELEQLSVAMDVVPYSRATDDVRVRALYHFDGDTQDSSYWNYCSDFEWSNAASITYMESDPFNGALYLDGGVTSTMNFYLPTDLGAGDFTIQFRYYQGQNLEEASVNGLYLNAGEDLAEWKPSQDDDAVHVLRLLGDQFDYVALDGSAVRGEDHPVGSWFEVCLTREGDTFTYFLNGRPLMVTDEYADLSFNDRLTFHYVSDSAAYVMIDELRVLNYAIASGENESYEPTAVPHDTNLALVLPEDKVVMADEYWTFESSNANLLEPYGLADWTHMAYEPSVNLRPFGGTFTYSNSNWYTSPKFNTESFFDGKVTAWYNSKVIEPELTRSGLSFDLVYDEYGAETDYQHLSYTGGFAVNNYGVPIPFAGIYIPVSYGGTSCLSDGDYVFTVVNAAGTMRTIKFQIKDGVVPNGASNTFGNLRMSISNLSLNGSVISYLFVGFNPKTDSIPTQPVVYMELVRGTSTDLKAEFHEDVVTVDKDKQFRPTLAVKTDIEIEDYQIGGVRPAIPEKGLVYALVESGFITSLQIYNGQAWEAVTGRIWTGQRWIPYNSFHVITLQDMYDISDATEDYEYIYTESGFWSWWQTAWNSFTKTWDAFTERLFGILEGDRPDVGLDDPVPEMDPENEDNLSFWEFLILVINGGKAVVTGVRHLFSGVVSTVPDAVNTLTGAFDEGGIAVAWLSGGGFDPDFDKPVILVQPQNVSTVPDGVATFRIVARGSSLTYQWQFMPPESGYWNNNTSLASAKTDTFRIESPGAWRDGYQYRCVVTDRDGNTVTSDAAALSVVTTGAPKNIFYHTEDCSAVSNGVQVDYDAGANEFTLNGSTSGSGDIYLIPDMALDWSPGEKYTLTVFQTGGTAELAAGSGITYSFSLFSQDNSKHFRSGNLLLSEFPAKLSFTNMAVEESGGSGYKFLLQCWRPGTTFDNYSFKVQLEKGTESTAYAAPFAAPVMFNLRRPVDTDPTDYYETEVLDPWRYR